ncbi:SOUL family heme-binding protein [Rubrivivax albus]|uniref:Heme-binding protein n=1 Tax=Rubrivivax albus TaxID=2499835 RepID=A0A3S2UNN1_9BURK|nr:heme-binding protein [Rubrivivax albus]RVT50106.1 heme-binding protein [Rubrivivax albus]
MKTLYAALAAITLFALHAVAHAIEEPAYEVLQRHDTFEVRQYAPTVVAEVVVAGPAEEAGNQGFRLLADYIFGNNRGARKIEMTAPVTQAAEPVKIAMTAPVTQAPEGSGHAVRFVMPRAYDLDSLPEPVDPRVRLREVPGERYAVIRYSGRWTDENYEAHLARLQQGVQAAGLVTAGSPVYARYDPPWVPWFMRRNEIWLRLVV